MVLHHGPYAKFAKVIKLSADHETAPRVKQSRFRRLLCQTTLELGTTGSKSKGDYDFVMEVLLKSIGTAQVPSFWVKSTLPVRKILA